MTFVDRVRAHGIRPEALTDDCLAREIIGETKRGLDWQDVLTLEYAEQNAYPFHRMKGDVPPSYPTGPRDPFAAVTWQTPPSEAEYARIDDYPGWPFQTLDDPEDESGDEIAVERNPDGMSTENLTRIQDESIKKFG